MANKKTKKSYQAKNPKQQGEKILDLKDASNLTIGELNVKSDQLEEANKSSVLDDYIRKHRDEIEQVKSDTLDKVIQKEKEAIKLETPKEEQIATLSAFKASPVIAAGIAEKVKSAAEPKERPIVKSIAEETKKAAEKPETFSEKYNLPELSTEKPVDDEPEEKVEKTVTSAVKKAAPIVAAAEITKSEKDVVVKSDQPEKSEPSNENSDEKEPAKKSKKVPIIAGAAVVILAAAGATVALTHNQNQSSAHQNIAQSSSKAAAEIAKNQQAFDQLYDKFFTDSSHKNLKNSELSNLTALQTALNKLKNTTNYNKDKSKFDSLKTSILALDKVNTQFDKPAIVNGKLDSTAQVKSGADLSTLPKTDNSTLNNLLAQAISQGKMQTAQSATQASQTADSAAIASQAAQSVAQSESIANSQAAASSAAQTTSSSNLTASSTTQTATSQNPSNVTVNNSNARVQPQAGLDTSNAAFDWAPGIEDKVLDTCRSRGYFTGNDYILLPVAIHTTNGSVSGEAAGIVSGYYNLYKSDGTYLVSINCKTGYWFGTTKGLPLDFSE